MAQLQLFLPTPAHRHVTPAQAGDPADHRCRAYDVPIYRVTLVRECSITAPAPRLRGAQQAAALLRQYLGAVDREHFVVILLDRKNTPIGINTVSMGSLTASVVHMRETFKAAILANAAAILCGHNHPSGDPEPSREDRTLTQRLVDAGKLLGIPLIDHVVIGDGTTAFFSFADQGLL
jgi:DNA repair protein RadC